MMIATAYHGSKEKFNQFNFSKMGINGTSCGKGTYFTTNKDVAIAYAQNSYLYTVNLHINNSLFLNEKHITRKQLKKLFLHLYKLDEYHLSDYGDINYHGLEKVLLDAVEMTFVDECDVEMISGIANTIGSVEIANNALYEVLGYDSIIVTPRRIDDQTLYIALINDIIEIVTIEDLNREVVYESHEI